MKSARARRRLVNRARRRYRRNDYTVLLRTGSTLVTITRTGDEVVCSARGPQAEQLLRAHFSNLPASQGEPPCQP